MRGKTKMQVSQEQMCEIVQHWLINKTMSAFMDDTNVISVAENASEIGSFDIVLQNTKTEEIKPVSLYEFRNREAI